MEFQIKTTALLGNILGLTGVQSSIPYKQLGSLPSEDDPARSYDGRTLATVHRPHEPGTWFPPRKDVAGRMLRPMNRPCRLHVKGKKESRIRDLGIDPSVP